MEIVSFNLSKKYSIFKDIKIKMPKDNVIYPVITRKGLWGKMEMSSLEKMLDTKKVYDLIDVGANVGLITLYLNSKRNLIENSYCIEPDNINFDCLQYNTREIKNCNLFNFGLDRIEGTKTFYKDVRNHGNNSMFKNQELQDAGYEKTNIKLVSVAEFFINKTFFNPIIYKSDTQGNDITIINNIPDIIWNKVNYAIIEVWNMNKEDLDKFLSRLSRFNKFIQGKTEISFEDLKSNILNLGSRQINIICGI